MAHALTSIVYVIFFLTLMAGAFPINLIAKAAQDVYVPHIIKPDGTSIWSSGENATVIWDASDAPVSISNEASILLHGYGTIVRGFDLRAGNVTFTVPFVAPGSYIITLFGDSSNYSPIFTVLNKTT